MNQAQPHSDWIDLAAQQSNASQGFDPATFTFRQTVHQRRMGQGDHGWDLDLTSSEVLTEKTMRCLRIAQLIFHNTKVLPNQKVEVMAGLLMKLPDNDIETIRDLLEDFTVEENKPLKLLSRYQIL